jgi:hypothetical protein
MKVTRVFLLFFFNHSTLHSHLCKSVLYVGELNLKHKTQNTTHLGRVFFLFLSKPQAGKAKADQFALWKTLQKKCHILKKGSANASDG